jgi:succinate dehydrogenase / fumarate reductase cytochrome b subunit
MITKKQRPKNLNLLKIHQPVTAVVSVLHRVSGVILFLIIPLLIYALGYSLSSESNYIELQQVFSSTLIKWITLPVVFALMHHLFAGIRFLLLDLDIGVALKPARLSAWLVFATLILFIVLYLIMVMG